MKYKRTITAAATAVAGQKYPIYHKHVKIGEAEFLGEDNENFEFNILLNSLSPEAFNYHVDLDIDTSELASFRASEK